MEQEYQTRRVPVQTMRMEAQQEVREVPVTVQRPVVKQVPVQVLRWEPQQVTRKVPVTHQRIEYEDRVESIPVQVLKTVAEPATVEVRKVVPKWVAYTSTRRVAKQVWLRVPIGVDVGATYAAPQYAPSGLTPPVDLTPPSLPDDYQRSQRVPPGGNGASETTPNGQAGQSLPDASSPGAPPPPAEEPSEETQNGDAPDASQGGVAPVGRRPQLDPSLGGRA
jgi:hypothetical protein